MEGKIKEDSKSWQEGMAKNITFIVTKDCQLACKYCYLVGKNVKEHVRYSIQSTSKSAEQQFIYQQTGWKKIGNFMPRQSA